MEERQLKQDMERQLQDMQVLEDAVASLTTVMPANLPSLRALMGTFAKHPQVCEDPTWRQYLLCVATGATLGPVYGRRGLPHGCYERAFKGISGAGSAARGRIVLVLTRTGSPPHLLDKFRPHYSPPGRLLLKTKNKTWVMGSSQNKKQKHGS